MLFGYRTHRGDQCDFHCSALIVEVHEAYGHDGAFEIWLRKLAVNTCL